MHMRHIILAAIITSVFLAAGCVKKGTGDSAGDQTPRSTARGDSSGLGLGVDPYPIPLVERPYQDVHPSVNKAINLTELAYWMIKEKRATTDPAEKAEADSEVESSIFVVNATVEGLYKEAIAAEPDNPLNYAAYAVYLKPRKRVIGSGFTNCESEALAQIDKAIEIWPDESVFYLLKVFVYTEPHRCHDWVRASAMEELGIASKMEQIEEAFSKAERYFPADSYINYAHAITKCEFTDPAEISTIREDLFREIRAGNKKHDAFFYFPPPLRPYVAEAKTPRLFGTETEPKCVDQWLFFGTWDIDAVNNMMELLTEDLSWPRDKTQIVELMFFVYRLGATVPYDRSFFTWQQIMLDKWMAADDLSESERLKLAEAARYLSEILREQAGKLYAKKVITDQTKLDVAGISQVESGISRRVNVKENLQAPQAKYLQRFGEIFKVDFPLPEDPKDW
jgi:hypothetical protein